MAQTTRSSSRSSSSGGSRTKRSTSRNGSSGNARSSTRRTGSNSRRSTASGRRPASQSRRTTSAGGRARQAIQNGPIAKTGGKVAELASKAKGPLLAGGAALAGVAGGVALKSRNQNRRPIKRLSSVSLPKSVKNLDLSKIDLDVITDAARTVRSIGEQVGDVADAAEKTRKKHK